LDRDEPSLAALGDLAEDLAALSPGAFVPALPVGLGTAAFKDFGAGAAFAPVAPAFFVAVTAFTAVARVETSPDTLAFFDDSPAVLGTAALLAALEAFAFTTAPFFLSAATTLVGTVSPS